MKRMITLCFFLFLTYLNSQPVWEYVDTPNNALVSDFVSDDNGNLYACNKGIFKSSDGGDTWKSCSILNVDGKSFDGYNYYLFRRIIHIQGVLIVSARRDGIYSVFRSVDQGSSWQILDSILQSDQLIITCDKSNNIYICNRNGLYKSSDLGVKWTLISANSDFKNGTLYDIVSDRNNNIYVAKDNHVSIFNGLEYSWKSVTFINGQYKNVRDIEIFHDKIYATSDSGLFVSDDNGMTWKTVDFFGKQLISWICGIGQNLYVLSFGDLTYPKIAATLYVSSDTGTTFSEMVQPKSVAYFDKIHGSNKKLYLIGFGVYLFDEISNDWIPRCTGIDYPAIRRFLINKKNEFHAFGQGHYYFKRNEEAKWEQREQPGKCYWPISTASIDSKDNVYYFDIQEPSYHSTDNGLTWESNNSALYWITDFFETKSGRLVATSNMRSGFYFSDDNGETWNEDSDMKGANPAKYTDDGIFIVAENFADDIRFDNTYKVSYDNGNTWEKRDIIKSTAPEKYFNDFDLVLKNGKERYMFASECGIYNSTDLFDYTPANGIGCINTSMMKRYGDLFFASTDSGIYRSEDLGLNWSKYSEGLPNVSCSLQSIDNQGRLYISTIRGVYRTVKSVTSVEEQKLENPDYQIYPNPVTDGVLRINAKANFSSIQVLDIFGNIIQAYDGKLKELVLNNVSSGTYFIRLNGVRGITTQKFVVLSSN